MTKNELDYVLNKNTISDDKQKVIQKYIVKEKRRKEKLLESLLEGASEQFKESFVLFPIGRIPCPVRLPAWMFRKFPDDPEFELDDEEKVALAHVIHFTNPSHPWGYLACSGGIENWLKCTPKHAYEILSRLVDKNMIFRLTAPDTQTMGHKRNDSYIINVDYLHTVLICYETDIWN